MAAYATLVSAMNIIDNLQLHPHPPISLHIKQVESLTQKLTFLQEFLQGYNPHLAYSKQADPLEIRIADAAYAAEYAIESHIFYQMTNDGKNISNSDGLYEALEKVIQDMASIEEEAKQIQRRVGIQHQLHKKSPPSNSMRSASIAQNKNSMVGADDVKLQMMDKLTSDRLHLQIIPIVGMGGSGKTTLARTIYEERLIKEYFDICGWATISQEYSIREIFAGLLSDLYKRVVDLSEDELGEKLYKHLFGRRYLIIMDDMWSIDAWDRVRNYFPDNKNCSRIVITTRLSDLASNLPNSNSLGMKLLDEANSWDLLSKTVFGEEGCPLELEEIGKNISKNCKGLPLSIVVVGGLLAKSKHREFWEYIEKNLNASVNLNDDERCLKILYTSYQQLPVHLKPCFLYMGVFPEDKAIEISNLIKYWIAEGFIKPIRGKSLKEIAKVYLKDLIGRNLILIDELRSTRNQKMCKIHDLLRDLCLREAEKERFYNTASDNEAISSLPSMSLARSLAWDVPKLSVRSMSLLRIVDSTRFHRVEDFFDNVDQLVNSRFLYILSYGLDEKWNFPSSIWRFWNLQTLIFSDVNEVVTVPTDFWYMPHIRHVEFYRLRLTDPPNDQDDIVLGNLQRLGTISDFKCSEQVVKKIPNIKKLDFHNWEYDDMYCLSNLDSLTKLESLYCTFSTMGAINFPQSLKRLILCTGSSYCWEDILDKVGELPHLQKLTLYSGKYIQGKWETTEGQFRSLKFLTLTSCFDLEIWTAESSHFPCLERLHLIVVHRLVEIPLDFAEIPTLREIVVNGCSDSAVVSAKRISEEHEDYYGEGALQVRVSLRKKSKAGLESLATPNFRFMEY